MKKFKRLNPKQAVFVLEYLKTGSAVEAARRAGYTQTPGCGGQAHALLHTHAVKAEIAKHLLKYEVTADRVIRELAFIAFSNMQDYLKPGADGQFVVDLADIDRQQFAAVAEYLVDEVGGGTGDGEVKRVMRTRLKLGDKLGALELLGRYLKLFTDRVELGLTAELVTLLEEGRQRLAVHRASLGIDNGNTGGVPALPGPTTVG